MLKEKKRFKRVEKSKIILHRGLWSCWTGTVSFRRATIRALGANSEEILKGYLWNSMGEEGMKRVVWGETKEEELFNNGESWWLMAEW